MSLINGFLMSKNKIIAEIENSLIINPNNALLPLHLLKTGDLSGWLKMRAIDDSRVNSRLLKKALKLEYKDDINTVMAVNAAAITDTYWIKEINSELSYEDVKFKINEFDLLALNGDFNSFNKPYSRTPELTNIGSFEKCWHIENGEWWLFKQASLNEMFSELFTYKLGVQMGFNMAEYVQAGKYIKSRDFTHASQVNYEPAYSLVDDNEDYSYNYRIFKEISPTIAEEYFNIILLDTIVFNVDRHTFNYGVLRDVDTGNCISLAPNFDNNVSLIARHNLGTEKRVNDKLIEFFENFVNKEQIDFYLPTVSVAMINQIISEIGLNVDRSFVVNFIMNGYEKLQAVNSHLK